MSLHGFISVMGPFLLYLLSVWWRFSPPVTGNIVKGLNGKGKDKQGTVLAYWDNDNDLGQSINK